MVGCLSCSAVWYPSLFSRNPLSSPHILTFCPFLYFLTSRYSGQTTQYYIPGPLHISFFSTHFLFLHFGNFLPVCLQGHWFFPWLCQLVTLFSRILHFQYHAFTEKPHFCLALGSELCLKKLPIRNAASLFSVLNRLSQSLSPHFWISVYSFRAAKVGVVVIHISSLPPPSLPPPLAFILSSGH